MPLIQNITSQDVLIVPTGINSIKIGFKEPIATQAQLLAVSQQMGPQGATGARGPQGYQGYQGYQGVGDVFGNLDGGTASSIYGGTNPVDGGSA